MVIGLCLIMILFIGPFLRPESRDTATRDGIEPSYSSASCFYPFTVSHHQVSYVARQLSSSSLIARPSTAGRLAVLHRLGAHSHLWSTHDKNLRSIHRSGSLQSLSRSVMSPSWPYNGKLRNDSKIKKISSRYSPTQVLQWLTCVGFPGTYSEIDISSGGFPITLENLHILTRLSTIAFPIENTALHYGTDHIMDISADSIFQRLVVERKGSYCFGLNGLFLDMLRGLGYRAYSGSGKVNDPLAPHETPEYLSFVHMVLFVQPIDDSSETYLVDVGCGGNGPSRPILLSCDPHNVVMGVSPTEKHRLTRGSRPQSSLDSGPEGTEWRLEVLQEKGPDSKWKIVYSFLEDEFFETDYTAMNFGVSMSPGGFFVDNIVYGRNFWLTVDEARELGANDSDMDSFLTRYMGRIGMRGDVITRHIGSGSEVIRTATTELEQRDILRELCGIDIPTEDLENVTGRSAAVPLGY